MGAVDVPRMHGNKHHFGGLAPAGRQSVGVSRFRRFPQRRVLEKKQPFKGSVMPLRSNSPFASAAEPLLSVMSRDSIGARPVSLRPRPDARGGE